MTDPRDPDRPYMTAQEVRDSVTGLSAVDSAEPPAYVIPDATIERFIARYEGLVEFGPGGKGVAFTPRTFTETVEIGQSGRLFPRRSRVTAVTAMTYNVGTAPDFETVVPLNGWELQLPDRQAWPFRTQVTVTYVHGYPEPPPAIIDGCIEFVRAEVLQQRGSQPRNVTGERTDLGWIPEPSADPSQGRPTRWNIVNEAIAEIPDESMPGAA